MRSTTLKRLERLEAQAPPAELPEPHVIVFVNMDKTEHSRIVLHRDPIAWNAKGKRGRSR